MAPDPCAFRSFASCEGDMEKDGKDDCDLSMFVVHADITDMESGFYHAGGISMVWVDSESSTGYSMKHITEGDARFAGKRAMYIEATKVDERTFFVRLFGLLIGGTYPRTSRSFIHQPTWLRSAA